MHRLEVAQQKCCGEASNHQDQVAKLEALSELEAIEVSCACESNDANSANCDCLAAETSRGLASFDQAVLDVFGSDSDPSKFSSTHGTGVMATGCGCGPANEAVLVSGDEGQRVFGVEFLDVLPANLDSTNRVDDHNPLVANQERWTNQTQPCCRDEKAAPGPSRKVLPIANQNAERNQSDNCCQNDAAPGSKNLHVSHVSIIAGDVK